MTFLESRYAKISLAQNARDLYLRLHFLKSLERIKPLRAGRSNIVAIFCWSRTEASMCAGRCPKSGSVSRSTTLYCCSAENVRWPTAKSDTRASNSLSSMATSRSVALLYSNKALMISFLLFCVMLHIHLSFGIKSMKLTNTWFNYPQDYVLVPEDRDNRDAKSNAYKYRLTNMATLNSYWSWGGQEVAK